MDHEQVNIMGAVNITNRHLSWVFLIGVQFNVCSMYDVPFQCMTLDGANIPEMHAIRISSAILATGLS